MKTYLLLLILSICVSCHAPYDAFKNSTIKFEKSATDKGLLPSKFKIESTKYSRKNVLGIYFHFYKSFNGVVTVDVSDSLGKLYGSSYYMVIGKQNAKKYVSFVFSKKSEIQDGSRFDVKADK